MRLYWDCPDDELTAVWASQADSRLSLDKKVKEVFGKDSKGKITYFPLYGKYSACAFIGKEEKYMELTEDYYNSVEYCAAVAIKRLEQYHAGTLSA